MSYDYAWLSSAVARPQNPARPHLRGQHDCKEWKLQGLQPQGECGKGAQTTGMHEQQQGKQEVDNTSKHRGAAVGVAGVAGVGVVGVVVVVVVVVAVAAVVVVVVDTARAMVVA